MIELVRLNLRRDRWPLLTWVLGLGLLPALMAWSTRQGYPDQASIDAFVRQSMANASEVALRGPIFAATVGGLVAWTICSSGSLVTGVAAILFATRYVRTDEAAGRTELVLSRPTPRGAVLGAALAVCALAGIGIGVLAFVGLAVQGLEIAGSLLVGLVLLGSTLFFGALGAVGAEIASSPGLARGLAFAALGVLFVVAAAGDATGSALVWFSPFGWARYARAFAGDRFWVVLLPLLSAAALAWVASLVDARRDLGGGVLAVRPGRSRAAAWVRGPFALAWRLNRGAVLGWCVGLGALGLLLGSTMSNLDAQLDSPAFRDFAARHGGGSVGEVFFLFVLYVLAQVATVAALALVLGLRTEETGGLGETLLAAPVTSGRWASARMAVAAAAGAGILLALAAGAAATSGRAGLALQTLAYLPSVLVVAALGFALVGWLPRAAVAISWAVLGALLLLDLLAEFALLPSGTVSSLSPYALTFAHLVGGGLFPVVAGLSAGALALGALGYVGLRRRDLQLS